MTDVSTLMPCPFECGHSLKPVVSGYCLGSAEELQTATDKWSYTVRCSCGAQGPEMDTEAKAIAAWKLRASSTDTEDGAVERYREALRWIAARAATLRKGTDDWFELVEFEERARAALKPGDA
jgi:hypothetical protein